MIAVPTVTTMHEQVHDRAEQNQPVGQQAEDVCRMLGGEVESRDGQEDDQDDTCPRSQKSTEVRLGCPLAVHISMLLARACHARVDLASLSYPLLSLR